MRDTVAYACEIWTITKTEENKLEIWKQKLLRRICGGIKVQNKFRQKRNRIAIDVGCLTVDGCKEF